MVGVCVIAKWWKYKTPHGQESETSKSSFKARFVAHFLINSQTEMKRQADLLTGISCMISQGKVVVISCRIQIRARWRYSQSPVRCPSSSHVVALSLQTHRSCLHALCEGSAPPGSVNLRVAVRFPEYSVTIQQSWVRRGGSQNSKRPPENHTSFNTFNNDSKAAQQDSQLTHQTCVCSVRDCVKMVSERRGYRGRRVLHFCHLLMKTFNDVKSLHFTESSVSS